MSKATRTCAPVAPPAVGRQALTRPSQALRSYQGRDFEVSVPSNWTAVTMGLGTAMTTYPSAPDGKRKREGGGMTVFLGAMVGSHVAPSRDLTRIADQQIRSFQDENPGLRVLARQPTRVSGLAAESILTEELSDVGEMERSWLVITLLGDRVLFVTLTSPVQDYDGLRGLFGQIMASVHLRAM